MDGRIMDKKRKAITIFVITTIAGLAAYMAALAFTTRWCVAGGAVRNFSIAIPCAVIAIAAFVVSLILLLQNREFRKKLLVFIVAVLLSGGILTAVCGYKIYESSIPYNGHLS